MSNNSFHFFDSLGWWLSLFNSVVLGNEFGENRDGEWRWIRAILDRCPEFLDGMKEYYSGIVCEFPVLMGMIAIECIRKEFSQFLFNNSRTVLRYTESSLTGEGLHLFMGWIPQKLQLKTMFRSRDIKLSKTKNFSIYHGIGKIPETLIYRNYR